MPRRLSELEPQEQRRAVLRTALLVLGTWAVLLTLYYFLPDRRHSAPDSGFRLAAGIVLVAAFVAWQTTRIGQSELPELRAVQAVGTALPLVLVVFSGIYLTMAHSSPSSFSQPLDHTSALYFTITTFATVGFGDITPTTDPARIVVSLQMLLDLVIIGVVIRPLFSVARTRLERGRESR